MDHPAFTRKVFDDAHRSRTMHPLIVDEMKRNGSYFEYVYTAKHDYVIVECFDVTEERKREADLTQRALYDEVTGIPNRMFF